MAYRVQLHLVVGFRFRGIVLKSSKVAGLQICREYETGSNRRFL